MSKGEKVNCPECNAGFKKKTYNHRFCSSRCKDKFHNWVNPRGKFAHLKDAEVDYRTIDDYGDQGWDAHKDSADG